MRTYKARGIHTIKYGDSSAIAYLFTDVLGRMSYMVQGIRSKRGRGNKAALLQPMFLVEFEGVEQPHAQMHRVREMRSLRPLMSVPFDVRKSTISMFMAEVLYRLIREVEANKPLFDFLCEAVLKLDAMREGIANYHLWFLVGCPPIWASIPATSISKTAASTSGAGFSRRRCPPTASA